MLDCIPRNSLVPSEVVWAEGRWNMLRREEAWTERW